MSKDADRLNITKRVQDKKMSGVNLKTGKTGLRELSERVRDSDSYGTPLSKGAISAGFKKVKDAPLLERMKFIHGENKELDKKATQAAREAGAEERREARGMKKGGATSKWIQSAIKKPGSLRKSLGVKKGAVIRQNNATTNQSDINISNIAEPTYSSIPNKLTQGLPIQYWFNRQSGETNPTTVTLGTGITATDTTITVSNVSGLGPQYRFRTYLVLICGLRRMRLGINTL
jgi:hypothetical protein